MILVIAGNLEEARELAADMGWADGSWTYVDHYRKMVGHRGSSVYIYGTGMLRPDYSSIEGLFLQGGHIVTDMMA